MKWQTFHHPDLSWPIVRRRARQEFMELLELFTLFAFKGGWAVLNKACYPNHAAYRTAACRLRKQGLIVSRTPESPATPQLTLTDSGKDLLPAYFNPERFWDKPWNKIWYLIVYDVPEKDRRYRNILRQFLKRKRMGCLQQSVWITPEDIRPDFDDLSTVASVDTFAYLFESRTVLGLSSQCVVEDAWNLDLLNKVQEHFCAVTKKNIDLLRSGSHAPVDITALLRLSLEAFHSAMSIDPLLPHALHPSGYLGRQVLELHHALFAEAAKQSENYI